MTLLGATKSHLTTKSLVPNVAETGHAAHRARVEELRRLVAEGKYQVSPRKLALKILTRALQD